MPAEYTYFQLLVLICLLAGCVSTPKLENVESGIAVGYVTIEILADTAATAYEEQWIDESQKHQVVYNLQRSHDALQDAQGLAGLGRLGDAQDALHYAERILTTMQDMLREARP